MLKHRGGVLTQYSAATSLCPSGYHGTGPSASLGLLDVAHGYAIEAPPCTWPRGVGNGTRPLFATPFQSKASGTQSLEVEPQETLFRATFFPQDWI